MHFDADYLRRECGEKNQLHCNISGENSQTSELLDRFVDH